MAGPVRRWAYRSLIRRARRVVAVAEAVRQEMVEVFRVPARRVVTIPNAVDHRRMLPVRGREAVRRELGIPPEAPVILTVAALTAEKDPVSHLQAVGHVLRAVPGSRYLVAGHGPLRTAVEATVGRLGLDGRVLLLGRRDDVPDLMSASDVLLLASRTEGMPAILIEAGMAGVPSVAYAVSGVPEVVEDGVTGLLAPPGDCTALAERARLLLEDGEARRALGRAARERCRERFDIGAVAPAYVQLYDQVAGSSRRGRRWGWGGPA
jgi:glycosyltransferase involved in cell wall biosynthesis